MLTPEQKEIRKTGIGGSDASAVAGISRYKSNVDVYLEKIGMSNSDDGDNEPAYWGHVLEDVVAQEYCKRTNKQVAKEDRLLRSEKYPWMIANVDRIIVNEAAILECKTCSAFKYKEWGADGSDEIPDEYIIQCAHYAIVTDAKYVDLAVLMGGQYFGIYTYQRNKKLESSLIDIEHDFWHNHVEKNEPPMPKTYTDVCKLFGSEMGTPKEINSDIEKKLQNYCHIQQKIKELNKQSCELKTAVCNYLGNDSLLLNVAGEILATWKNKKISRFDTTTFKEVHPDIYKQFLKTTETREFRTKGIANE
jgi:putative phage-type endonuclease